MKRLFTIIALVICCFANAQVDNSKINYTDKNGKRQGTWKKVENGHLVYEGQFKDGVPYGEFKYYHKNGKLKSKTTFEQGVHKVKTIIYYENGHIASKGAFIDQQKDGEWRYFAENDTLVKIENYKEGSKNGLWKIFSPETGILLEECNYLNNTRNGLFATYYVNGVKSLEENYLNGKTNGKSTAYYPNQNISVTGNYLKGWRDGEWHQYDVNGKIRTTYVYKNQALVDIYIYMYIKGVGQRINQNNVAYFVKKGDKTIVVLRNKNKIQIDESFEDIQNWLDFTTFIKANPRYIVAINAIKGYKKVKDSEDAIIVKIVPRPDEEIYSEGVEAKLVKALFNFEKPVE